MTASSHSRCGLVAIIGRSNVGKSTFLNRVLGRHLSITAGKPQTTRYRILGVKTTGESQSIYVDTPGLDPRGDRALQRYMNREATRAMADVDVVLFMVEALRWTEGDEYVANRLRGMARPTILVISKIDRVADKRRLLPFLAERGEGMAFEHVVPISSRRGDNVAVLEERVRGLLPIAPLLFPEGQISDRSEAFFAAELIREKLTRRLDQEVPHRLSVLVENFVPDRDTLRISAAIWVERDGQKRIVVGKGGAVLKEIGMKARQDMERMFGCKVFLHTWVRVKERWSDDERALRRLGFDIG